MAKNVIILHSGYPGVLLSPLLPSPYQSLCSHSVISCLVLEMLRHHRESELGPLSPSTGHLTSCPLSSLSLVTSACLSQLHHALFLTSSLLQTLHPYLDPTASRLLLLPWLWRFEGAPRELWLVLPAKESHSPSPPLLWSGGFLWGLPFLWVSLEAVAQVSFALRFPWLI